MVCSLFAHNKPYDSRVKQTFTYFNTFNIRTCNKTVILWEEGVLKLLPNNHRIFWVQLGSTKSKPQEPHHHFNWLSVIRAANEPRICSPALRTVLKKAQGGLLRKRDSQQGSMSWDKSAFPGAETGCSSWELSLVGWMWHRGTATTSTSCVKCLSPGISPELQQASVSSPHLFRNPADPRRGQEVWAAVQWAAWV